VQSRQREWNADDADWAEGSGFLGKGAEVFTKLTKELFEI